MKKFPLFLLLLAFISCGPSKYIVPVEVCHPSKAGVELTDKVISVIYYDDEDESAIKSKGIAESFAESLEKSYVTPDGDIKVYRLPAGSGQHYASKDSLVSLLMHTGADFVFLFDKLKENRLTIWSYDAMDPNEAVKTFASAVESDTNDMSAVGARISSAFMPQWKTEQYSLAYFDSEKWYEPLIKAEQCDWYGALELWLQLLQSKDPLKRSCAEYNIAVACHLLGDNELASEWLDRSDAECELSMSSSLRKRLYL